MSVSNTIVVPEGIFQGTRFSRGWRIRDVAQVPVSFATVARHPLLTWLLVRYEPGTDNPIGAALVHGTAVIPVYNPLGLSTEAILGIRREDPEWELL